VNPNIAEIDGVPTYRASLRCPWCRTRSTCSAARTTYPRCWPTPWRCIRARNLWLQQGLWSEPLAEAAQADGLRVVMDR
jgi:hypothetical protein